MRLLRSISSQLHRAIHRNPSFHGGPIKASEFASTTRRNPQTLFQISNFCTATPEKSRSSESSSAIAEEIAALTLLEIADLTEALRERLGVKEMPAMAVMMPGMGIGDLRGMGGGGGGGGVAGAGKGEEKKAEKTAFDLKLDAFDAASKIKVIKEVRSFTDLGLKEAKELVEKAPAVLKKGVTKEEAESIIAKMKAVGAKVSME